jgi:hypothetical protein
MKTYQELRQALDISSGTLTISGAALGQSVGNLLTAANQDQPLVISGATAGPGDGESDTVVITGRGNFLQMPDLPVTARFSLDADGNVRALLKYQLRDAAPGPTAWTFSRSFPKLPPVWNYALSVPDHEQDPAAVPPQKPYLDSLNLFDTGYIAATHAGQDPETNVPLEAGVNFVSRMRPQGTVGVLEAMLGDGKPLTLYGAIRIPKPTDRTLPLTLWQRPWERPDVPGIFLRAPLGVGFNAGGKLLFNQTALRVFSPTSTDWQSQNDTFKPMHGYVGRLSIPSANIEVDLSADLEWGVPRAFLYARCEGVTLGKLTQLADLAGTDAISAVLPEPLRAAADALNKLELLDVSLNLRAKNLTPTVDGLTFTVGMPGLVWKVWDDQIVVRDISCRFEVRGTAPQSSLAVTLMGTVVIEGVPISVMARSASGFSLYATLDEAQTIPLAKLMKTYVPDVPPPSDLTVKTLALILSPGRSYSMAMQLAGSPKPWVVPLGKSNVTINDVSLNLNQSKGASTTGSFAGTASFGKSLTLAVGYTIPGSFSIRGVFPKVNLTQMVEEMCDQKIPLPGGFDLVLENAAVLIQKQGDNYTFRAATSVKDFGLFAFEIRKVAGSKWGFAAGMNMGASGLSKLPGLGVLKSIEDSFKLQKLMLVLSSFEDASFAFPDMAQFNQPQLGGKVGVPAQGSGVIPGLMLYAEWMLDDNSREQKLLKNLLGLGGTQSATLAIGSDPSKDFRLYVSQKSAIQKQPFQCMFGMQLSNGKPSFFLTGSLVAKIQGQTQNFDVATAFLPGGAFLSATMKGATGVDCGPFKLSNLALQIGVNWGGIPSLGIAANIDTKGFSSSVAVFFDSTDPSRSLVAGSISSVTAKDVMNVFVSGLPSQLDDILKTIAIRGTHQFTIPGDLSDELDGLVLDKVSAAFASAKVTIPSSTQQLAIVPKTKGASWHLTDLTLMRHYQLEKKGDQIKVQIAPQFYFAPQPTSIGTIKFPQAFYINAAISFAGFDASATIDISPNKGLSIDAQMDKIVIVDDKLFSISALQGGGGPKISVSTFAQPQDPVAQFRQPHFYINGSVTMLGARQGVFASVTTRGIEFELVGRLVPGVNFDLDARFGKQGIGANGTVKVGVGTIDLGALGKAKINTELEVEVDIDIDNRARDVSTGTNASWPAGATILENESSSLVFQTDSNLVLYRTTGTSPVPVWASGTNGRGGSRVAFQGDGNLVIYTGQGTPIWASNTNGSGATRLTLQSDGNLVIYDGANRAKWNTGTNTGGSGPSIELETSFEFAGQRMDIARFRLEAKADTFTKLPDIVAKKVEDALRDVFKDMTKWSNAVKNGVMDGVNDTSKVFKDVYGKSEKEAKDLANSMSKGVNQATKAVENTAKSVTKSTTKAIKKVKFW